VKALPAESSLDEFVDCCSTAAIDAKDSYPRIDRKAQASEGGMVNLAIR
jgi:hypothetical protein